MQDAKSTAQPEKTIKVWVNDEQDQWDMEVPDGDDIEQAVRSSIRVSDYGAGVCGYENEQSQHVCITYGLYDEDGEPEVEGSFTATEHPEAWNDGEGWEEETVRGSKGGVKIWFRKDGMTAVLDTWHQHPHNGQVCENDHIVIYETEE